MLQISLLQTAGVLVDVLSDVVAAFAEDMSNNDTGAMWAVVYRHLHNSIGVMQHSASLWATLTVAQPLKLAAHKFAGGALKIHTYR